MSNKTFTSVDQIFAEYIPNYRKEEPTIEDIAHQASTVVLDRFRGQMKDIGKRQAKVKVQRDR